MESGIDARKRPRRREFFNWYEIPGEDDKRLLRYLNQIFFATYWLKGKIQKIDDKTIKVTTEIGYALLKLNDKKTKVNIEIEDGRTVELIAEKKNGELRIHPERWKMAGYWWELRDILKMKIASSGGIWINPDTKKEYKERSLEMAMIYFLSPGHGRERRLKELGRGWRYVFDGKRWV